MTRVYVDVVCDLFHVGHIRFFEKARSLGDELVVGVCSDELVESYKRRPILSLDERSKLVESCRLVDRIIRDPPTPITLEFMDAEGIDIVAHGDDFDPETVHYWYGAAIQANRFRTVSYSSGISTTEIIERVAKYLSADT
jgi:cytidyltransferase-like protein